jgi:hypothetical protein
MIRFLADADFSHAIIKRCRRYEPAIDFLSANKAKLEAVLSQRCGYIIVRRILAGGKRK